MAKVQNGFQTTKRITNYFQKKISHQLKKPNARMPPYKPIGT
jgi:hypothetical protein